MRTPARHNPPRPFVDARKKPRSRPEAAAELTRLEYERDRLERDLAMIRRRKAQVEGRLSQLDQRARALTQTLK